MAPLDPYEDPEPIDTANMSAASMPSHMSDAIDTIAPTADATKPQEPGRSDSVRSYEDGVDESDGPLWRDGLNADDNAQEAGLRTQPVKMDEEEIRPALHPMDSAEKLRFDREREQEQAKVAQGDEEHNKSKHGKLHKEKHKGPGFAKRIQRLFFPI